ncbi:MAG: hypothetical protein L6Q75_18650 [Burkholderiaceae bacterium]|nr:hypothetical protein [Burkholderiaceae bacterium]
MIAAVDAMTAAWATAQPSQWLSVEAARLPFLLVHGVVESSRTTALPADAIVTQATATIRVEEAGRIAAGQVAQVRQGAGGAVVVIDFGTLRTVASLQLPTGRRLSLLRRWAGSSFTAMSLSATQLAQAGVDFAEVQTERLELTFTAPVPAAEVARDLTLLLPGAPKDLLLEIGGQRVWSRPGAAPLSASGGAVPAFEVQVPLTAELQAALAQGANPTLTLRSGTPCAHALTLELTYVRRHEVVLPPAGRTFGGEAEQEVEASLPLPADSATWEVVQVDLGVSGRMPAWRGWPLPDPATNPAARLVLDPAHSYAARLPAAWLAPLAELTGLRLPLLLPAGFAGAEIAAVLYQGNAEHPLTPLPAARFTPAVLEPAPGEAAGALRWVELALARPVRLEPGAQAPFWWVELSATRGGCEWPLSEPPGAAASGPSDEGAAEADPDFVRLRRSLPGPPFRPLAVAVRRGGAALQPAGRLRVLGTPRSDDLRPGVVPVLAGHALPQVAPGFTPTPSSGTVRLTPASPASAARGEIADQQLRLKLRLHGSGQVTLTRATVFYRTLAP